MNKKLILALSLAALALAGCSPKGGDASSSSTESAISSSEEEENFSSSEDPDDQIFNRDDGKALEVKNVSNPYTVGTTTNSAKYDYTGVYANKPTNDLVDDFAFGVDCS